MSYDLLIPAVALVSALLAVSVSWRLSRHLGPVERQQRGRISNAALDDLQLELSKAKAAVGTMQTELRQKSQIIAVLTQELIDLRAQVQKLEEGQALLNETLSRAEERAVTAENQVKAYQDTVKAQTADLAALDDIARDAEAQRQENLILRRRLEEERNLKGKQ